MNHLTKTETSTIQLQDTSTTALWDHFRDCTCYILHLNSLQFKCHLTIWQCTILLLRSYLITGVPQYDVHRSKTCSWTHFVSRISNKDASESPLLERYGYSKN